MRSRLLVGVDDTDSRQGGCTTALADRLFALFPELQPAGPPRLVRLNPNVPWKTRGNGAVAVEMTGSVDLELARARVAALVEREAERAEGTDPGVVVSDRPLPAALYDAAVSRVVDRSELPSDLVAWGGRGVIGAAAALAWPAERATWERIAYRDPREPRAVDPGRVRLVEQTFASVFDSYDLVNHEVVCVPSSPCPVLWGLRGDDPEELLAASRVMGPHRPTRETLFLTNQGTDDHLRDGSCADAQPYLSLRVRARVAERPAERNGHVFVRVVDATGSLRCAAYAPTLGFRRVVAALREGDEVVACGGVHAGPDGAPTLGLEKLAVERSEPRRSGNPRCPKCNRAMKSAGRAAGFRCCGQRSAAPLTAPSGLEGWHEVPSCARRHLAMPLKRMLRQAKASSAFVSP